MTASAALIDMWTDYGAFEVTVGSGVYFSVEVINSGNVDGYLDLSDKFTSFSFKDPDNKADSFTIKLHNSDLTLFDDPRLFEGQVVKLSWGYYNLMTIPRKMKIKKVKGWRKVTIEGIAMSVEMDKSAKFRRFDSMTHSEIAEQIALEEGFDPLMIHTQESEIATTTMYNADLEYKISASEEAASEEEMAIMSMPPLRGTVIPSISQFDSNAKFLARLAVKAGFVFFVDHTGFHFHRRKLGTPPMKTYSWGIEVDGVSSRIIGDPLFESEHTHKKPGVIKVVGIDDETGVPFEVRASNSDTSRDGLGSSQSTMDPEAVSTGTTYDRLASEEVIHSSAKNEQQAKEEADAKFFHRSTDRMKLSFKAEGDPRAYSKGVIQFWCASKYVSGAYYTVDVATDISNGGFTQSLKLSRDASNAIPLEISLPDVSVAMPYVPEGEEESADTINLSGTSDRVPSMAKVNTGEVADINAPTVVPTAEELPDGSWQKAWSYQWSGLALGTTIKYTQSAGHNASLLLKKRIRTELGISL